MISLAVLHWGTINVIFKTVGDAAAGNLEASPQDGVISQAVGRGDGAAVLGRGGTKTVLGRGGRGG